MVGRQGGTRGPLLHRQKSCAHNVGTAKGIADLSLCASIRPISQALKHLPHLVVRLRL